jgi:hypothetical protein
MVQTPPTVGADEPLQYVLVATAGQMLVGVTFEATVPPHTTFVTGNASEPADVAGPDPDGTVSWSLNDPLQPAATVQILLFVRTDADLTGVSTIDFGGFRAMATGFSPLATGPVMTTVQ